MQVIVIVSSPSRSNKQPYIEYLPARLSPVNRKSELSVKQEKPALQRLYYIRTHRHQTSPFLYFDLSCGASRLPAVFAEEVKKTEFPAAARSKKRRRERERDRGEGCWEDGGGLAARKKG